jgi:hypothetical protein
MIPWFVRFCARLLGILVLMLSIEIAAFYLERNQGVSRLYWVPLSYAMVAWAGYQTVKRLPLIWGTLAGVLLAGSTNVLSWLAGGFVNDGRLGFPPEADPMLVATGGLLGAVVGGVIGTCAGLIARGRRRTRSRREALGKLGHAAFDDAGEPDVDIGRR